MSEVDIPAGAFTLEAEVAERSSHWAIVSHPHPAFGGRMDNPLVIALADALEAADLSTVRFNFRGLDRSGGTPTGGLREHEDVRAVAAWARARGAATISLVGYSFGALMSLKAIAAGEPTRAFAAVGLPTTIIGDHPDRIAEVKRAMDTRTPSLFVSGDRDQFCEVDRLREWLAPVPTATLIVDPGMDHFPSGPDAARVCAAVARFCAG